MRLFSIIVISLIILPGIFAQHGDGGAYTVGPGWHWLQDVYSANGVEIDSNNDGAPDTSNNLRANSTIARVFSPAVGSVILRIEGSAGSFSSIDFLSGGAGGWGIGRNNADDFYIDRTGVGNALKIDAARNIGIGEPAAITERLTVNGGISMTEDPDSPDDLFDRQWADDHYLNEGQANSVTSNMIVDNSITSADITDNSINSNDIVDNSITSNDIQYVDWSEITNKPADIIDGDQTGGLFDTPYPVSTTCWSRTLYPYDIYIYSGKVAVAYTAGKPPGSCDTAWRYYTSDGWSSCLSGESCVGEPSTTPYLFTGVNGKYLIENDIMNTFFQTDGLTSLGVERAYRTNRFGDKYFENEYYRLNLKPDTDNGKIQLRIHEIEPEESNLDSIELIKVVHKKGTVAFSFDYGTKGDLDVAEILPIKPIYCVDEEGAECLQAISYDDGAYIEKDKGGYIIIKFRPLAGYKIYMQAEAWLYDFIPEPIDSAYEDAYSGQGSNCFNLFYPQEGKWIQLDRKVRVHVLPSANYREVPIEETVDSDGMVTMKVVWDERHRLDDITFVAVEPAAYKTERLGLLSALHTRDGDVTDEMLRKDYRYAHIVRGDKIDLVFDAGELRPGKDEVVDYFFVSQGYYHGLRTYLYPEVDTSDSYIAEVNGYVDELNAYLKSKGTKEVPFID